MGRFEVSASRRNCDQPQGRYSLRWKTAARRTPCQRGELEKKLISLETGVEIISVVFLLPPPVASLLPSQNLSDRHTGQKGQLPLIHITRPQGQNIITHRESMSVLSGRAMASQSHRSNPSKPNSVLKVRSIQGSHCIFMRGCCIDVLLMNFCKGQLCIRHSAFGSRSCKNCCL